MRKGNTGDLINSSILDSQSSSEGPSRFTRYPRIGIGNRELTN